MEKSHKIEIFRFYRSFFFFCFYFVLSLISFTFRPGLSAPSTFENGNDTLTRNSSNITTTETLILKLLQSPDLSKLITNSFTTVLTSNFKSLNITQESLEKMQLEVTSNFTSALKNFLFLILNDNEGILNMPDETAIHTPWYTDSFENTSNYFMETYNRSVIIDVNSTVKTIISSITLPKFNNHDTWCV